ncbi:MAG: TonB-dependent receptor [Lysobacteraceae bacterium]|nr:MAG: TonB-dependent receptor [Xanthomonadaceae bacterium]
MAQDASAQEEKDDSETLDTIVVTGIRKSILDSRETKLEADSIVEAVSAEDLGKLPDLSIAESLARLPGLAAQRVDGRAQVIAIRGMSPDFAATQLNGREQVSTGDNRGVEFDQYPSELLDSAVVYKNPDATLIGQGLSGTVDLRTIRPLAFGRQRFVANLRGENHSLGKQNPDGSDNGYRVSASYVDQFADNTLGIALGVAELDSPFQEQHYKAWWWGNTTAWGGAVPGKPSDAAMLEGAEIWARSRDQVRDGLMGVLEYKPNDMVHSTLDVYYSRFEQKEAMRGIMWSQDPWTGNGVTISNVSLTDLGGFRVVSGATVNNLEPVVRNDLNTRDDTMISFGLNNQFQLSENWSINADGYYSRAKRDQQYLETYAGSATLDSIRYDAQLDSSDFARFSAGLDYTNPQTIVLTDPAGWGREGRLENTKQDDRHTGFRAEIERTFLNGPFEAVQFGFAGTNRVKDKTSSVFFAQLRGGATTQVVDPDLRRGRVNLGFSGIPGTLAYDVNGALARYYDLILDMSGDDLRKDFTVRENIETFYSKLDFDTDFGDWMRLRGNVGVQLVHSKQSSTGFDIDNRTVAGTLERGTEYDDVLPSVNLVGDFGDGWMVRFGAAKTMARPRVDDMRASASAGVSTTTRLWSGNGGNPLLEPWRATSVDLSMEKYFGEAGYVAIALFYKDLETYIYNQRIPYDFSGFTNPTTVVPISNIGTFSTPANGKGGYMRGAEVSTSLEGGQFADFLDGFGLLFNASYTETSIDPNPLDDTRLRQGLPGLSKVVGNLTAYYEKNGFSARVNQRYRSEFQGEITALFAQRSYTQVLADRQTDLQIGYEFKPDTMFSGWSVIFQVNNVLNSPYRTVQRSDFANGGDFYTTPLEYNEYGRQFLLGLNFKM